MPPVAKKFQDHETCTEHDRGVGHVERVPVMDADMEVDEIRDAVAQKAIENISCRAAENQREARTGRAARRRVRWRGATGGER